MMSRGASLAFSMSQMVLARGSLPSGVVSVPSTQYSVPWSDALTSVTSLRAPCSRKAAARFLHAPSSKPKSRKKAALLLPSGWSDDRRYSTTLAWSTRASPAFGSSRGSSDRTGGIAGWGVRLWRGRLWLCRGGLWLQLWLRFRRQR